MIRGNSSEVLRMTPVQTYHPSSLCCIFTLGKWWISISIGVVDWSSNCIVVAIIRKFISGRGCVWPDHLSWLPWILFRVLPGAIMPGIIIVITIIAILIKQMFTVLVNAVHRYYRLFAKLVETMFLFARWGGSHFDIYHYEAGRTYKSIQDRNSSISQA